ncbi:uncharacterized protein [Choristoneura fumiferana]|uniref:uncharacterized protein n=1 Tax=Choristoneura fumiferana TaxID=7141 RepID=UPI003D1536A9
MFSSVFFSIAVTLVAEFPVNHAHTLPYRPVSSEWPMQCSGRTYCHIKPSYYPDGIFEALLNPNSKAYKNTVTGDIENREGSDIACSANRRRFPRQIYLIKDNTNEIRFVMQTGKMNFTLLVEECRVPGRVWKAMYLTRKTLERQPVYCVEKKSSILLPVLSLDGSTLESVAPKDGIPFSCSAQIMKN